MLPPSIRLKLQFIRNTPEKLFRWDSSVPQPIIKFTNFYIELERVRLDPNVTMERIKEMTDDQNQIEYPINRYRTDRITFNARQKFTSVPAITQGVIPRRIVISFVQNEAASDQGSQAFDSLYFENLKIDQMELKYDNKSYPKEGGYKFLHQGSTRRRKLCRTMYNLMRKEWNNEMNNLELDFDTWYDFANLYVFDMTPSKNAARSVNCDQVNLIGDVNLEITFETAATENYSICMLSEYNNMVYLQLPNLEPIFNFS